jgi:hypothetical protein
MNNARKSLTNKSNYQDITNPKPNNNEKTNVLMASFFNSGSNNFGALLLYTTKKCFEIGM